MYENIYKKIVYFAVFRLADPKFNLNSVKVNFYFSLNKYFILDDVVVNNINHNV